MIKVNKKKIKPYGDRLDDGVIQMSFTLPVSASPEAKQAAKLYVEGLGLKSVAVATMESLGEGFSHFVVYGNARPTLDFTRIKVPKVDIDFMDFKKLTAFMADHIEEPIIVVGAATGSDAHTVGIDAIMNMKGFGGDYGLERYPLLKAHNLRSQLTNQQLIDKAIELKADAILISQVVTQRDSHIKNLKEFRKLANADKRLSKDTIILIGGPRLDHAVALKLGFDAGFGTGTKPSQVANFIVRRYMKAKGIDEKKVLKKGEKGADKKAPKKIDEKSKKPLEKKASFDEKKTSPSRGRRGGRGGRRGRGKGPSPSATDKNKNGQEKS
jgi:beta-lysine 5,6-aminomutase beta subunit